MFVLLTSVENRINLSEYESESEKIYVAKTSEIVIKLTLLP